jgi:hypothetical protein
VRLRRDRRRSLCDESDAVAAFAIEPVSATTAAEKSFTHRSSRDAPQLVSTGRTGWIHPRIIIRHAPHPTVPTKYSLADEAVYCELVSKRRFMPCGSLQNQNERGGPVYKLPWAVYAIACLERCVESDTLRLPPVDGRVFEFHARPWSPQPRSREPPDSGGRISQR